jgi:hypothetical protein
LDVEHGVMSSLLNFTMLRYQMALVVESGWFEKELWQQVSHLLLKYTKSGYGTVLTAACTRQGCSATEWMSESGRKWRVVREHCILIVTHNTLWK